MLLAIVLHGQHYAFRQYGPQQGLLNIEVRCLLQDRVGFLWIGNENGLFRFDGKHFLRFGTEQGLPDVWIQALHQSPDGTLWVGTRYGIAAIEQGKVRVIVSGPVRGYSAQSILSGENGEVYLATSQGLLKAVRKENQWQIEPPPEVFRRQMVAVYFEGADVWFTSENALWRFANGELRKYSVKEGLPNTESWTAIVRDKRGNLYVRSRNSVRVMCSSCSGFKLVKSIPAVNISDHFASSPDGKLLIPTDRGVLLTDGTNWIGRKHGLPDDPVSSLLWDREGALWIGTATDGLWRWSASREWENFDHREGLESNIVSAIHRSESGVLWVGTRHGLYRMEGSRFKLVSQAPWAQEIRGIRSGTGGVFIGSSHFGLVRIDEQSGAIWQFGTADGLEHREIIGLDQMDNTLWVYTRGGVFLADMTAFRQNRQSGLLFRHWTALEKAAPETQKNAVYRVRKDSQNRLWAATLAGLYVEDQGQWRRFGTEDGLKQASLPNLAIDSQDHLWITYSADLGVSKLTYRNGKLSVQHLDSGYCNSITFTETGPRGSIWIGTDTGVTRFRNGSRSHYGIDEGLIWPDTVFNAFFADIDGSSWIGTTRGLAHFRPGKEEKLPPHSVVLTEMTVNGQQINPLSVHDPVRSGANIKLSFSALSFQDSERIRYRYRLLGLDDRWVDDEDGNVRFSRLGPGAYQFEVLAFHPLKNWKSQVTAFRFRVAPRWWQRWWALAAGALLLYLVIVACWRWRVRILLAQKRELEQAVALRTREIQEEKLRVEAQKQQIEYLLQEARQANKLKDEFLANISHEIRTPLHGVLGMTGLVLGTDLTKEQQEYLQLAETSASSLLHLLNDLLDFSKIEAGRLTLENVSFSLRACLETATGTMAVVAREKGLRFQCSVDDDLSDMVFGDPGRLRQVLSNLISNAVKFTESGSVTIRVFKDQTFRKTGRICFLVRDTGVGIAPENWSAIFEPFRQADGSTTRKFGGTGLGLSICKRLAELMNGELKLESEVGKGTLFTFIVPLTNHHTPSSEETASPEPKEPPRRVLLVEDNLVNLRLGARLLSREGCKVITAVNGREALTRLAESNFSLVLVDLQMPDMDGIAVVQEIRRRESGTSRRTPVAIVTASASVADRNRAFAAGVEAYLMKPIQRTDLQRLLATYTSNEP